jgi:hypothetical protein
MDKDNTIFVLGAKDPEMDRIEALLTENDVPFIIATHNGQRVDGRTAYQADPLPSSDLRVVFVESEVPGIEPVARIDHHREGDPGYGKPAAESIKAASIGQLCLMLGIKPTHEDEILAAMDHNFAAAANGEVPGVTAGEVMARKINEIAKSTGRNHEDVTDFIARYRRQVTQASDIYLDQEATPIKDLRSINIGLTYSLEYLTLQVAVVAENQAALVSTRDQEDSSEKIILTGRVPESLATEFMQVWAPQEGLTNVYGVPSRGYAGGYRLSV